jgi:hypothetical protein
MRLFGKPYGLFINQKTLTTLACQGYLFHIVYSVPVKVSFKIRNR